MISNLNPSSEAFLANVERVQRTIEDANRQVTSGKRVNIASDAPDDVATILQLRAGQARNEQIQSNLAIAKTDADAADSAFNTATKLMDRARTLAAQGNTFTIDADGRASLASEAESLLEQMVSISQTVVQGRYIFGGDEDSSPPYQIDLSAPNGVTRLTNASSTRRVEDAAGGTFAVARTASEIFDARNDDDSTTSGNVFAALNSLRTGLLSNDPTQIAAASTALDAAAGHLNLKQAFYGTVLNRIQDATTYASTYGVQLKTELGNKQDADITAAALAVTQGNTELQASFAMQARMPRTTLFDFMA